MFLDKQSEIIYYVEIKYNDNHDTGKYIDINRKFLKSYTYLLDHFKIENRDKLVPILFHFTSKKMKPNNFLPEGINILRGEQFFKKFLNIEYDDVITCLKNLSEDENFLKKFEELYEFIVNNLKKQIKKANTNKLAFLVYFYLVSSSVSNVSPKNSL